MRTVLAFLCLGTPALACAPVPDPVLTLDFASRYAAGDAARATLDPEAEAAALAALDPVEDYLRLLARQTGAMLGASGTEQQFEADCLISQIATWARADALADQRSETVQMTIGSRLAALALMLRAAAPLTHDYGGLDESRAWLTSLVEEQMRFWETAPNGAARGNLRAWAALAAAALADLNDDAVMRAWATWSVAYVACQAEPDGALPQEMTRGRLALHYQLHAVAPLVTSALLLERQRVPILSLCDGAIARAARFAIMDLAEGEATAAKTGEVQSFFDGSAELKDYQLAWLEPYLMLATDPQAEALAAARRPLSFSKLGGNQSLLWAR